MKDLEWIFISKIGMIKIDIFLNLKSIDCLISKNFLGFNLVCSSDLEWMNSFSHGNRKQCFEIYFLKVCLLLYIRKCETQIFDSSELSKIEPEMSVLIMDTACFIPYFYAPLKAKEHFHTVDKILSYVICSVVCVLAQVLR